MATHRINRSHPFHPTKQQSTPTIQQSHNDNLTPLQRAIENPTPDTLTPDVIEQLQSTHGNQFVNSLIQQSRQHQAESTSTPSPTPIQRWQSATPSNTAAPTFSAIQSDDIGMIKKLKGLKKAKKSAQKPQKLVEQIQGGNQDQTREETPSEHGGIISENASIVGQAMHAGNFRMAMGGLQGLMGILGQYIGLGKTVYKFIMGIKKTIKNFKTRRALQKTMKTLQSKIDGGSASASDQSIFDSVSYGFRKVNRRFILGIANTVIALGKAISTWVTFFTGGTTLVFTSIIDLLTSSAKSVIKGYQAAKAIYKERKGIKGVARAQNAQTIIESAFKNQPEALQLMLKLKVGKKLFAKMKKQGKVNGKYPKTTIELKMFLVKLSTSELDKLRDDLKKQLSSVK